MCPDSSSTPILLIAFNRAETIKNQFTRIDTLTRRKVHVSIDGARCSQDETAVKLVKSAAQAWGKNTHHEVEIIARDRNFGLHGHSTKAYAEFFSHFNVGLILEDDIEFRKSYVDFLDNNSKLLSSSNSWSIQGHNPSPDSESSFVSHQEVFFRPTHIHTIWGWAANAINIDLFLSFLHDKHSFEELNKTIQEFAKRITSDPFLTQAIRSTWLRKMQRAIAGGGSWDNWLELAAWNSGKLSFIPNISLSRETLNQDEGQSHPHESRGMVWAQKQLEVVNAGELNYSTNDKRLDIELLRVWGINRKYSWAKASLVRRQLLELEEKFQMVEEN